MGLEEEKNQASLPGGSGAVPATLINLRNRLSSKASSLQTRKCELKKKKGRRASQT